MRVSVLQGLQPYTLSDVTRVVICGDDGTVVAVACEWSPGVIQVGHAGEVNFHQFLAGLGMDDVKVDLVRPRRLSDIEV